MSFLSVDDNLYSVHAFNMKSACAAITFSSKSVTYSPCFGLSGYVLFLFSEFLHKHCNTCYWGQWEQRNACRPRSDACLSRDEGPPIESPYPGALHSYGTIYTAVSSCTTGGRYCRRTSPLRCSCPVENYSNGA